MFEPNKYTEWYSRIIERAKDQNRSRKQGYFERHHIIPKSLGGQDDKSNMVFLTAREHFIVHLLLTKMTKGAEKSKMVFACLKLSGGSWYLPEGVIRSRSYEFVKKLCARETSKRLKGRPKTKQHIKNMTRSRANSESYQQAIQRNREIAHEKNTGRKRPTHSAFMTTRNAANHNEVFEWFNKNSNTSFRGSRIDLVKAYPNLRLDELWKVTKGHAKSHKGWYVNQVPH